MAKQRKEFILKIDAYTPATMPMSRLAEYMADLATLLGEHAHIHFVRLGKGSTNLVHAVEYEAEPKVRERIRAVRSGDAPLEAMRAERALDKKLADDNTSGRILEGRSKLLEFPGKKKFTQPTYGPFNQSGTIDGIPIRVGGQEQLVPVHLQDMNGEVHICHAKRPTARDIAPHLFTTLIRVSGIGRWHREKDGTWEMDHFTIETFRELKDEPLTETVAKLRLIKSGLGQVEDPLAELQKIRHGS